MAEPVSLLRTFGRSAGVLAVLNVSSMAIAFLIGIILARLLGASGYGIYGLALAVATLAGTVAEFGLPTLVVREVARARDGGRWSAIRGLLAWSNYLLLGFAALLLAGWFLFELIAQSSAESRFAKTLLWALLLVPIVGWGKIRAHALLSLGRSVAGQFPVMVLRPAMFLLVLAAIWATGSTLGPEATMAWQVGAATVALAMVALAWRRYRPDAVRDAAPEYAPREWAAACVPMGASEGLRLLQGQSAILMLGLLASPHEAGLYRVADSIMLATGLGQSAIAVACGPLFARLWAAGDKPQLQRLLAVSALGMVATTIALGLPIVLLGEDFLALLFSTEFRGSYQPFVIAWLALMVSGSFGPLQVYANMAGHQKLVMLGLLLGIVTNVAIAAFAIPRMGATGAAVGVIAGSAISSSWMWWKILSLDGLNSSVFSQATLNMLSLEQIGRYARSIGRRS